MAIIIKEYHDTLKSNVKKFFKSLFIYLFMRDTEKQRQRHRQREKQGPCKEPKAGLNPRSRDYTLGQRQTLNR